MNFDIVKGPNIKELAAALFGEDESNENSIVLHISHKGGEERQIVFFVYSYTVNNCMTGTVEVDGQEQFVENGEYYPQSGTGYLKIYPAATMMQPQEEKHCTGPVTFRKANRPN